MIEILKVVVKVTMLEIGEETDPQKIEKPSALWLLRKTVLGEEQSSGRRGAGSCIEDRRLKESGDARST